jgi:DNA-binding transcriptional LysR family regulator
MEIVHVRYFLALCEVKNFTRAAKLCGVSQPSLSNAIRTLEDEFGGLLFERKPRVRLSALGQSLKPHFDAIWSAVLQVERVLCAWHGKSGRDDRAGSESSSAFFKNVDAQPRRFVTSLYRVPVYPDSVS